MAVKLFVLGLPGSGKSTVARYIKAYAKNIGRSAPHFNDYDILCIIFQADDGHKMFSPTEQNDGFDVFDFSVLDIVLEKLEKIDEEEVKKNTPKDELIVVVIDARTETTSSLDSPLRKTFRAWIPTNEKNAFCVVIS